MANQTPTKLANGQVQRFAAGETVPVNMGGTGIPTIPANSLLGALALDTFTAISLPLATTFLAPIRQQSASLTNQSGGALLVGQALYLSGLGAVQKAQANNDSKAQVLGLALTAAANGAAVEVVTFGLFDFLTTPAVDAVCGTSGGFSAPGKAVWLSPSVAGGLTLTWPGSPRVAGQWAVPVGCTVSATALVVNLAPPIKFL